MTPDDITALFTASNGDYRFARWGRPIAPIVFGVEDATLSVIKGALEAVCTLAGHHMAETDPELGANLMAFFFRDWDELLAVPDLDRLVEGPPDLVARLRAAEANQYRVFRFDANGAIRACFVFVRMDAALRDMPAEDLALGQVVRSILCWSDAAFRDRSPLAQAGNRVILRPEIAALIRAGYDPVMPAAAQDASHALRIYARIAAHSPHS